MFSNFHSQIPMFLQRFRYWMGGWGGGDRGATLATLSSLVSGPRSSIDCPALLSHTANLCGGGGKGELNYVTMRFLRCHIMI